MASYQAMGQLIQKVVTWARNCWETEHDIWKIWIHEVSIWIGISWVILFLWSFVSYFPCTYDLLYPMIVQWALIRLSEEKFGYFCWSKDMVNFFLCSHNYYFWLIFTIGSLWSPYNIAKWRRGPFQVNFKTCWVME